MYTLGTRLADQNTEIQPELHSQLLWIDQYWMLQLAGNTLLFCSILSAVNCRNQGPRDVCGLVAGQRSASTKMEVYVDSENCTSNFTQPVILCLFLWLGLGKCQFYVLSELGRCAREGGRNLWTCQLSFLQWAICHLNNEMVIAGILFKPSCDVQDQCQNWSIKLSCTGQGKQLSICTQWLVFRAYISPSDPKDLTLVPDSSELQGLTCSFNSPKVNKGISCLFFLENAIWH